MAYQTLTIDSTENGIAVVTLNREDAANAINTAMALELKDFFGSPDHKYRAIILTGAGKHFCGGADLKERKNMDKKAWQVQHKAFREARDAVLACPIPVIAAVNGAAYGGGLELALACDFIYASREARFALTETTLGFMPGMGGTQTLPRAIGTARAKEYIFSGKSFSAEEAHAWGMVNKLCAAASLIADTMACAKIICANAPLAVVASKKSIDQGISVDLEQALECELKHYNSLLDTKDRHEGIASFNEKRKPVFKGE